MSYTDVMVESNKPRILIFSLAYFPFIGGAEIAVKEITDRIGDRFDFDLVTYKFNKEWRDFEKIGNVNVYRVKCANKFFFVFKSWLLAKKLNKENNYFATWSIMAAYAGFSALFFKFSNPKIPFLLTLQEGDSEKHILKRVGFFYPVWKLIFKKANYIQAISNFLADFGKCYGAICPIEVVPNGVNTQIYADYTQTNVDKKTSVKTIITTSRLVYKNGIDILIRAMAELKIKDIRCPMDIECPRIELLILGSGPEEKNLKKLAQNLGVVNEVIFIGHVEPDKIPEYLYKADIFVRPSRSEGLGNSFLEAMVAGLPVIGTRVGGIPDFIKDGETGIFCKSENPKDLASKIKLLFEDKNLSDKLSYNGRKLVFEKYSWDKIAYKIGNIINEIRLR
jgi:glycosyltransferase involved in cell wall biosynthesis